jgi:hypothetical protein
VNLAVDSFAISLAVFASRNSILKSGSSAILFTISHKDCLDIACDI